MEKTPSSPEHVTPPAKTEAQHVASPAKAEGPRPTPGRRLTRRGRLALAVIVVIVGAALAIPRTSYVPAAPETSPAGNPNRVEVAADLPAASASPVTTDVTTTVTPASAAPAAAPQVAVAEAPKPPVAPKVVRNKAASAPKASARKSDVAAPVHAEGPHAVGLSASAEPAAAPVLTSTPTALVNVPPPVTITGCLEVSVNSDEFRLTDTDGAGAPKSRSWKTGFLKKHSAPVLLVEAGDSHSLQAQVGKRVAATGHLSNQELKVSSMHVVSSSCD
jgi:hypothetical protein